MKGVRLALGPGDDAAALVRAAAAGADVLLIVGPGLDPLALALARAALAPLALERAPASRVNAVRAAEGADPDAVEAACRHLEGARATTGQWLEVG